MAGEIRGDRGGPLGEWPGNARHIETGLIKNEGR